MFNTNPPPLEKGISLLFVVLIMSVILAIGMGISGILIQQIRMMGEIGQSIVAFYAADSGIEEVMYNLYQKKEKAGAGKNWAEDYGYEVTIEDYGGKLYIVSTGEYKGVRRAIQATLPSATFPVIANAEVFPGSGPPGTKFTVKTDIIDIDGINPSSVVAYIQDEDENDKGSTRLVLIEGNEFEGTYQGFWIGTIEGVYFVDIYACDTGGYCSKLENLETLIQQ